LNYNPVRNWRHATRPLPVWQAKQNDDEQAAAGDRESRSGWAAAGGGKVNGESSVVNRSGQA
jgi:hypothetical protein